MTKSSEKFRCEGLTKKGKRCKNKTRFRHCHHHFCTDSSRTCTICLENGQETQTRLNCGHIFHEKCLEDWLKINATCPLCRKEVSRTPLLAYEEEEVESLFEMELEVLPPPRRMIPRRRRYMRQASRIALQNFQQ